jgi:hypothetical protein
MVPNKLVQVDEDSIQTEAFELLLGRFKLCVVKYQGEIFIPEHEGLPVIGASKSLLEDLNRTRTSRCRPWQDWLMGVGILLQQRQYQSSFLT